MIGPLALLAQQDDNSGSSLAQIQKPILIQMPQKIKGPSVPKLTKNLIRSKECSLPPETEDSDSDNLSDVSQSDLPSRDQVLTGISYFSRIHSRRLRRKYCLQVSELKKEVAKRWRNLTDEQRQIYEEEAGSYQTIPNKLVPFQPLTAAEQGKQKFRSGYMVFNAQVRQELAQSNQNLPQKEIWKLIGQRWRELPHEEKQYYTLLARQS